MLTLIPVLFGITVLAFVLGVSDPGDPVEAILNPDGTQIFSERDVMPLCGSTLGLDDPIPVHYVKWLKNAVSGEFGRSFFTNKEIEDQDNIPSTLYREAGLFWDGASAVLLGLEEGFFWRVCRDTWVDHIAPHSQCTSLSVPGSCVPAILMILIFCEPAPLASHQRAGLHSFLSYHSARESLLLCLRTIGVCARLDQDIGAG